MEQFVIVGAGRAGASAAAALRREGFRGRIILIGDEQMAPYDRPPLSKQVLAGTAKTAGGAMFSAAFYAEQQIELRLGTNAVAIDSSSGRLRLSNDDVVAFDRLLLATGSRVRRLSFSGQSGDCINYLRTSIDAEAIARRLQAGARVVIIGAGVIGMEVAASANLRGCVVTVVDTGPRVMARVLPAELSARLERSHSARGVRLLMSSRPVGIDSDGINPRAVLLEDGLALPTDVVVAGIGVTPETALAAAAGIEIDDGILVDVHCRTSIPTIFAAGDVARFFHPIFGRQIRVEAWQHAEGHAVAAAQNMLGRITDYQELPWMWSDQFDLNLQVVGLLDDGDSFVSRRAGNEGPHMIFAMKQGRLRGAAGLGKEGAAGRDIKVSQLLIESGREIDPSSLSNPTLKLRSLLRE